MIDIKYILEENDFLQLNLYFFKTEGKLKRFTVKVWLAFLILIAIISGFLIWKDELFSAIVLGIAAAVISIFHTQYMKKLYQKQFKKTIKSYETRFKKEVHLRIDDSQLHVKSIAGDTNLNLNQIVSFSETENYFFIKLKVEAIVISKINLENLENLKEKFKEVAGKCNVEYIENSSWKW